MYLSLKSLVPIALVLLVAAGCGESGRPAGAKPTKPVKVTVTYKGSPVEGATVSFISETPAYGRTDGSGVAQMKTYVEGDGAVVGAHAVTITKTETVGAAPAVDQDSPEYDPNAAEAPSTVKYLIPQKYEMKTSGLTAEVKDSGPNEFKFDLTD